MKRSIQYETLTDLSVLNREQRDRLAFLRFQELEDLPKEICQLIFEFCESKEEESLFKLGSVSRWWNEMTKEVMRKVYRNNMGRSDRILRLFTELTELTLYSVVNKSISDKSVSFLTNLTELNMSHNCITGESLSKLTNLSILRLMDCSNLGDVDICSLSQLTELQLFGKSRISGKFSSYMPNLIKLNIENNQSVTYGMNKLKQLRVLALERSNRINDHSLAQVKSITSLSLRHNLDIGQKYWNPLEYLPNLIELDLSYNKIITNEEVAPLTSLTSLKLHDNSRITDNTVRKLTNLTTLELKFNTRITGNGLGTLSHLTHLNLYDNKIIKKEDIEHLANLKKLFLSSTSHPSLLEIKSIVSECEIVLIK